MKKNGWVLYLFEDEEKTQLFKIMEFNTIRELGYVMDLPSTIISNWFHELILPRGILKRCSLFQTIPVLSS
jgi:hypothetical protein|tara:strand:- start:343 stop:555 length:213 start_codon:yes stop_codon:yes gene_type:complete